MPKFDPPDFPFDIKANRYGLYCLPRASAQREASQYLARGEVWEPDTIGFMTEMAGSGDIVHAGVFFGDFLPALSRALAKGRTLYCFEPNPTNFAAANATVQLNGLKNVKILPLGLSNEETTGAMRVRRRSGKGDLGGGSFVVTGEDAADDPRNVPIELTTVDTVIEDKKKVSILQLDIEGHERPAFLGAREVIETTKPILISETELPVRWRKNAFSVPYAEAGRLHENFVYIPG